VKAVQDGASVKVAQVGGRPIGVETAAFEVTEEEDIVAPAVEIEITLQSSADYEFLYEEAATSRSEYDS